MRKKSRNTLSEQVKKSRNTAIPKRERIKIKSQLRSRSKVNRPILTPTVRSNIDENKLKAAAMSELFDDD